MTLTNHDVILAIINDITRMQQNLEYMDDSVKGSLLAYSAEEEDWMPLFYDKAKHLLMGPDSPLLMTTKDYDRFESLDDDLSEVILNKDEIKRKS